MTVVAGVRIEPATERDLDAILQLIRALADYEHLTDEMSVSADDLRHTLFGKSSAAEVLLARSGDTAVGFAVFFRSYSTFLGRAGIYLEDLFVVPQWRRRGIGRRLFRKVAEIAVARGCGRLEWAVLDWNAPAIEFYTALGARAMDEWTVYRLSANALRKLGTEPG